MTTSPMPSGRCCAASTALAAAGHCALDVGIDDLDWLAESRRRDDFVAIALHVSAIEWQHIGSRGTRRARFEIGAVPKSGWLES